jgi:calcium-dependent protein kinase
MGNKPDSKKRKKKSKKNSEEDDDDVDGFFLEDWEILNDKDKISENINKITINNEILISKSRSDPMKDYMKLKKLGSGSFATVNLVKHLITGKIRAMKIILKKDEDNEEEILNEINVLKQIDHPNIVKIFEVYNSVDAYYLITEFCEYGELFKLIYEKKKLPEMQAAYIMYQIFSAIKYCHKMKIMHRDLKPENILIYKEDRKNDLYNVKICDFGTSQVFKKGEKQNQACGSVYYIAPEVLAKEYNSKCDLWSCGVILYMLLTNKAPFGGKTDNEIIKNIITGEYKKDFLKNVSPVALDLIAKLLEKDYKKRINADKAMNHNFFTQYDIKKKINNIEDINEIRRFLYNLKNYKCQSIIQEIALAFLIHNSPEIEDVVNAGKLFNMLDEFGDGKITSETLYNGITSYLGTEIPKKDILQIFENLDRDHNNYIGYEEFIRAAVDKSKFLNENCLKFAFKYFDIKDSGEITIDSITSLFQEHIKNKEIKESIKKILDEVDEKKNGIITFPIFCRIMKNIL